MDIATVFALVKSNVNPLTVSLLVLFVASEVLGTKENIKASSIFGVLRSMVMTAIEQAKPAPKAEETPQPPTAA